MTGLNLNKQDAMDWTAESTLVQLASWWMH